jgi:NAD(P)-dependent dehydrogenase (short-subunit alcohol dehydrogenase family)
MTASGRRSILLVGASRGLGKGLAQVFSQSGWSVTATVRDPKTSDLTGVEVMRVDIDHSDSVEALHAATAGRAFDVIFVVAGVGVDYAPIHKTDVDEALRIYRTNAISPIAFAERFIDRLAQAGQMAFMTSILGSIASNTTASADAYRASKSALNMLTKCFWIRHKDLTATLMHPGWVRTDMGGANADIDVDTSVAGMARVIDQRCGSGDLAYVDYTGRALPW